MKRLALLRHAKSSWDEPALADFDRPLNARGRRAAERMGAEFRLRGLTFDRVFASPARRVKETLTLLEAGYGSELNTRFDRAIYEASATALLGLVRSCEPDVGSVVVVGHNPGLQAFASALADGHNALATRLASHYPTAALAVFALPISRWDQLSTGTGTLEAFVEPRSLDPL